MEKQERNFNTLTEIYEGKPESLEHMKQAWRGELAPLIKYLKDSVKDITDVRKIPQTMGHHERAAENMLVEIVSRRNTAKSLEQLIGILEGTA